MRKGDATREKLRRAALALFVEQGVTETTTRDIAARAGIAEGTIYRHFASKDELAADLLRDQLSRLGEALYAVDRAEDDLPTKIRAFVRCYCEMADADWHGFSYQLLYQHVWLRRLPEPPSRNPVTVVRDALERGMAAGAIPRREIELVLGMALGVVMQTAIQKLYGSLDGAMTDYAEEVAEAVWRVVSQ
ncbi:MAG: TetR/AcrR family transcriptional regulator [Rhodospirillaceae bacterium]|nr:TetR/AcrR family transcriptional regulator [Rhodospirillaceae bacterium]